MLKFLRKIRHQLLTENKVSKYLLYALGEIILVMIGILLALQVNNWNEARIKRGQIKSQLTNLATSLKSDIFIWNRTIEINEFRFGSIEYLLEKAGILTETLPTPPKSDSSYILQGPLPDSLNSDYIKTSYSWFTRGFANIIIDRTGMEGINNLGLFSEINSNQLKRKIKDYYIFIDFHFSNQNIMKEVDRDNEFHDYLRDNYSLRAQEIPDFTNPIEFIKKDEGVIFRLKEVRERANWHCLQADNARNLANEIIEMIELEVER